MKYTKFHSTDEVHSWETNIISEFPSDNDADKIFLEALNLYTASANVQINNYLRYNSPIDCDDFIYPYFTNMVKKLPTYQTPDNIISYRYVSKGLLQEICPTYPPRKGMVLHDKGFMSTTLLRKSVTTYRANRYQNILLIISVSSGTKDTYVGLLKHTLSEYELILAPNTKMTIDHRIPLINNCFWCTIVK